MRVNVDSKALKDPRFKRLGRELGVDWHAALGLCIELWMYASEQRSEFMTAADADAVVDRDGFGRALVAADLAEVDGERLRLRGVRARIGWLDRQAEKGRAGGLASAKARRAKAKKSGPIEPGASAPAQPRAEAPAQRLLKQEGSDLPLAPDLSLALVPDQDHQKGGAQLQAAIAHFTSRFRQAYGHPPTWGSTQGAQLKRLLNAHDLAEVKRRTDVLFDSPPSWLRGPYDLGTFVKHFDKLVAAPTAPPSKTEPVRRYKFE